MFDLSPAAEHPNAALDTPSSAGCWALPDHRAASCSTARRWPRWRAMPIRCWPGGAGQVAMPVKIKRDDRWIIGSIRSLSLDPSSDAAAIATEIDLMGEGMRHAEPATCTDSAAASPPSDAGGDHPRDHQCRAGGHPRQSQHRDHPDRHRPPGAQRARDTGGRCAAGAAFRDAGVDRHRQVDRDRDDPAPHLRARAARPYRDDRSARRICQRVSRRGRDP